MRRQLRVVGRIEDVSLQNSRDAVGGQLLLDPGLTSWFEERLFADHEEGVRSVTSSSTNDSPDARKDWPGYGSSFKC
jgi:hypothetical protein